MKGARKQYDKIKQLPTSAQSVANYARERAITVAYVYKQFNQGKIKIVDFEGYNFVLTNG